MEKVITNVTNLEFTEFGTLAVTCLQSIDLDDLQSLFAARGGNTFVVFLRGLDPDKLEAYKTAMVGKEIEIVFHDFAVSDLKPSRTTLTWVDDDGEDRTITKIRAATANLNVTIDELRQMATDSLNTRVAKGAVIKQPSQVGTPIVRVSAP